MTIRIFKLLFLPLLFLFLLLVPKIYASIIPAPTGFVNDFAGVLTADQKTTLDNSLKNYEQQTGNEIAVALVKSLNGDSIEEFSVKTFEEWKIGKKNKDNGVLFLAAIDDKKMRIEVGYGAEPYITDSEAGDIIRNTMAPKFQQKDYYGGLSLGITEIEKQLSSTPSSASSNNMRTKIPNDVVFWVVITAFIYLCSFMARTKSIWLGGLLGIVIGVILGFVFVSLITGFILTVILGLLGLLLDFVLSKNYDKLKAQGRNTGWLATGGGFFGSRNSGGFGGFGGGNSGGGGSSGSW